MKKSLAVVLFLFVSSIAGYPIFNLPTAQIGSLANFFFAPEPAALATLYVDNPTDFIITLDQGAPGLDAGDTVTWDPGPGSAHGGPVAGLTFGTNAFGTVQGAINAAVNGDTINVAGGIFSEPVTVNKSVFVRGNQLGVDARTRIGVSESVVRGADLGGGLRTTSFNVTASNVEVNGFTVQENSSSNEFGTGIFLNAGTSGSEVRNNIVQDNITGLFLSNGGATQAVIERNLFRNNNRPGPLSGTAIYTDQFTAGGPVSNVLIDNNAFVSNGNSANAGSALAFSSTVAANPATNITISNNTFDGNARAMLAFNLTNSSFSDNTVQNSNWNGTADLRLFEGINTLAIMRNVLQNGPGRAVRVSNISTGAPDATNVTFRLNSISGYTGPAGAFEVDAGSYSGTLDATSNWWGDNTGPTIATNPGGTGQTIGDPSVVVDFEPWLMYGDADPVAGGFQIPITFTVAAQTGSFTATNNNYRRLVNSIEPLQPGQTLLLSGVFDWTEANAAASWALGNNGVAGNADDFTLTIPQNLNGVTISATSLGGARIQGPGDVAARNLERVFNFDGGDNQNWTISNLEIFDFDLAIGMFNGAGGLDAYTGTQIVNNLIRVPADLNSTAAPADVNQNIGIHFSFGANQTIQNNEIQFGGNGISAGATLAQSVGMQSNTSGGAVYDGLLIDNNTLRVLNAQSADPERILGIWEQSHAHASDITVSNNDFINDAAGNNPATNRQSAFRVTSHSSATTVVAYTGNTASGANVGFEWLAGQNFAGNQPVAVQGNTLTGVQTGFLVQSNGQATFTGNNSVSGTGSAASIGLDIRQGSRVSVLGGSFTNSGVGIDVGGVPAVAMIQGTNLNFNSTAGLRARNSAQVDAGGGGYTGLGTSTGGNDFTAYGPGGAFAIQNLNPDGGFTGNFTAAPPDMRAQNNIFASNSAAFIEQVVHHDVDVATQGFVDFGSAQGGNTTISINDVTLLEGNSGTTAMIFTVSLSNASGQSIAVNFATADGTATVADNDYQSAAGTATFAPGQTSQTVTVLINGDTRFEPNETFAVNLSGAVNATIADGSGVGTIVNDDSQPTISINDVSLLEGNSGTTSFVFTVSLSNASSQAITVNFATADGTATVADNDYQPASGTVTFGPGQTSQTLTVLVNGDTRFEPDETFTMNLSGATNATIADGTGVGTIRNDDSQPSISINDVSLLEGNSGTVSFVFTVSLSNASSQAITVNFATANGTATLADNDYQAGIGTITFAPGQTSQSVTVLVNGDTTFEPDETFAVNLSGATNATIADGSGVGTIRNDDSQPSISINDVSLLEGNSGTVSFVFTVSLSNASSQAITVNYATADGTATVADNDYQGTAGTVTFSPGQTSQSVTVLTNGDTKFEPDETFTMNLSGATNATIADGTGLGTIRNDDSQPTISINDVTVTEGNSGTTAMTFTLSLSNASSQTVTVNFATADGTATVADNDYQSASGTFTFGPGQTSQSLTVLINGDTRFEPNETFAVNLSGAVNATIADGSGVGTIVNDDSQPTISINDVSRLEGNSGTTAMTFTVSLSNASSQAVTVNFATADGTATVADNDYQGAAGTVTFGPGQTSQSVTVLINGDTRFEPNETFTVNLSGATNATIADGSGVGTIVNDDSQPQNTAPVANADTYSTNEDTPLNVAAPGVLGNDTDAQNDTLTATLVSGPAHALSFTFNADGSFSYTPNADFNGIDSFTYKANDGLLDSNVATVSITVNSVNDQPTVVVAGGGSCAGNSGTMNLIVGDEETDPGALVLSAASSNTALVPLANISFGGSGADRTVSIIAVPQQQPQESIVTITVTDGNGSSSQITITVLAGTKKGETINGTNGADLIFGLNGEDMINAGSGNDLICSENGGSTIDGGDGDDTIDGGSGNDVIRGGAGRDILIGGQGNDRLEGGDDDDTLTGGQGADFFSGGNGTDIATDFTPSRGDTDDGTVP